MKKLILVIWLSLILTALYAQTKTGNKFSCDKSVSKITYMMNHPLHSWSGVSKDVTAIIITNDAKTELEGVAVATKVVNFDSENANRDSHMMEVTEAIKYPIITFKSTSIKRVGENNFKITGRITFHGVSQEITTDAIRTTTGGKTQVTGTFSVKISAFKIPIPSLMGIPCTDEIKLIYDVTFINSMI